MPMRWCYRCSLWIFSSFNFRVKLGLAKLRWRSCLEAWWGKYFLAFEVRATNNSKWDINHHVGCLLATLTQFIKTSNQEGFRFKFISSLKCRINFDIGPLFIPRTVVHMPQRSPNDLDELARSSVALLFAKYFWPPCGHFNQSKRHRETIFKKPN